MAAFDVRGVSSDFRARSKIRLQLSKKMERASHVLARRERKYV